MHNKRLGRDDLLKIEVYLSPSTVIKRILNSYSGLELLHQHRGASILAVSVSVLQLVVALLAEVVAPSLLVIAAVVTCLLARMIAETVITTVETVIALAPQMTGKCPTPELQ
jgi:hypothetical protein